MFLFVIEIFRQLRMRIHFYALLSAVYCQCSHIGFLWPFDLSWRSVVARKYAHILKRSQNKKVIAAAAAMEEKGSNVESAHVNWATYSFHIGTLYVCVNHIVFCVVVLIFTISFLLVLISRIAMFAD